eukprot:NODE_9493_length_367_cov_25.572327_g8588_i0.p2 GENE.NODE_9493_length_367_cov_25.572327_g8588_i0~~NODE_9493_length_367_cov_25.572327_g8588_i0.p2  ORF type:complete len:91 (+),score=34.15 NODE_9493_length_367_cov_25.572327_g8588_i0:26-274(+)
MGAAAQTQAQVDTNATPVSKPKAMEVAPGAQLADFSITPTIEVGDRVECPVCWKTFAPERSEIHINICTKVHKKRLAQQRNA